MTQLISVLNATGQQGGSVVRELIKSGFKVRAFTRNSNSDSSKQLKSLEGVEIIEYDFESKSVEEISKVFNDSYGVFLVTLTPYSKNEVEYGIKVADAALLANVKHIVFSTLPDTKKITNGSIKLPDFENKTLVEKHIRQLSSQNNQFISSFVAAPMYLQNFEIYYPPVKIDDLHYSINLPGKPDLALDYGDISDIGKLVSQQFKNPTKYSGIVVVMSAEQLTGDQVASIFSKVTGKSVIYNYIPVPDYKKSGALAADEIADMFDYFNSFNYFGDYDKSIAKSITSLTTLEEYLKKVNFKLN